MSNDIKEETKPVYRKWWFWLIVIIFIIGAIGASQNENNLQTSSKVSVTVVDFSNMKKEEIENWCNENKVRCTIKEDYSNIVKKGNFINQSVDENGTIHQGDKIIITYSLGKEPTNEEKNALKKAEIYSSSMNMSKQGIYKQLTSSIEGFSKESAQYAIDNIDADWNKNALKKAKTYQQDLNMSKSAVYKQLISSVEGFTASEAQYAIDNLDN